MSEYFSVIFLALLLLGCSKPKISQQIILPGTLDLPILEGSRKGTACLWDNMYPDRETRIECILVPTSEKIRNFEQDIAVENIALNNVKAVESQGWVNTWNLGYTHGFEKPIDENCSHSIEVIMRLHAPVDVAIEARRSGNLSKINDASMIFVEFLEPLCGDKRKLK